MQSKGNFTVWRDFRANLRIIVQLAVGAVAFTTLAVGVVAHLVEPSLPWAACFALGAIVSPPDAVAAKAVLQGLSLPPRVTVLLEGESLVNDATGLVLYRFAVAAAMTGAFDAGQAAASFGVLALGGMAAGVAFGWLVTLLLGRLRDPTLSVIASFLAAWAAYIVGEALHVSGVLTTVACGLVMGWRQHAVLSAVTRTQAQAVWKVIVFILESLIFILIGLSLRGVVERLGGDWHSILKLLPPVAVLIVAVIVKRFIWISARDLFAARPVPVAASPRPISAAGRPDCDELGRHARRRKPCRPLALPDDFPGRDFVLATTFAVILVTVLIRCYLGALNPRFKSGQLHTATTENTVRGRSPSTDGGSTTRRGRETIRWRRRNVSPSALDRAVQLSRPGGRAFQRDRGRSNRPKTGSLHRRLGGRRGRPERAAAPSSRRIDS